MGWNIPSEEELSSGWEKASKALGPQQRKNESSATQSFHAAPQSGQAKTKLIKILIRWFER